ncbi:D-alanyl-D-alanine dipeptidase [Stenotrophomonas panacihumi]|uniref:D-alanyl-D-alanine dipeptidase n=1 Tax=Stenotrophomonas panacihumi TaxID=676599 RepID=A0A0R0A9N4_9GAMM|nr:D-alanyl-D-alanine dipeptidase [Stenotrophomonas panacihumi]PTN53525.1 D-alanyl-D-alanine dipeptidase [Stenotrophomonas panacihumi]
MATWHSFAAATALSLAAASALAAAPAVSPARDPGEAGMVDVATLAPGIEIDMRYAGADNFTGHPVEGYDAPSCLLLRPVAEALARVQARLHAEGYTLHVYDCYRPVRAVQAFVAWAGDLQDQSTKAVHYPRVEKFALIPDYIADHSGHSRGATIDLTLAQCRASACKPLDMGTDFDLFDTRAHTDSPEATPAQRAHRQRLRDAMAAEGFANYPMEWWHFTFRPEPTPDTAYDFPVR